MVVRDNGAGRIDLMRLFKAFSGFNLMHLTLLKMERDVNLYCVSSYKAMYVCYIFS